MRDDVMCAHSGQVAELALPGPEQRMSRNLSMLHDIVRGLVDKSFAGAVDYAGSLLTTLLQPYAVANLCVAVY